MKGFGFGVSGLWIGGPTFRVGHDVNNGESAPTPRRPKRYARRAQCFWSSQGDESVVRTMQAISARSRTGQAFFCSSSLCSDGVKERRPFQNGTVSSSMLAPGKT